MIYVATPSGDKCFPRTEADGLDLGERSAHKRNSCREFEHHSCCLNGNVDIRVINFTDEVINSVTQ